MLEEHGQNAPFGYLLMKKTISQACRQVRMDALVVSFPAHTQGDPVTPVGNTLSYGFRVPITQMRIDCLRNQNGLPVSF